MLMRTEVGFSESHQVKYFETYYNIFSVIMFLRVKCFEIHEKNFSISMFRKLMQVACVFGMARLRKR